MTLLEKAILTRKGHCPHDFKRKELQPVPEVKSSILLDESGVQLLEKKPQHVVNEMLKCEHI